MRLLHAISSLMSSMYGETMIKPVAAYTVIQCNQAGLCTYILPSYNYVGFALEVKGRCYINGIKSVMGHVEYIHGVVGDESNNE